MSDDQQHDGGGQRQCRRGITPDVELGAALALADMAGSSVGFGAAHERAQEKAKARPAVVQLRTAAAAEEAMTDDEEMASTRLSLQLGRVGIQSSSCSSGSSAGRPSAPATHGPRPRHMLTEAEKEAKRLRRVLANRESARQTILRRQAIRDELARKVADLSSENETIKKEKDLVMKEYLSLKETNKQLKAQAHDLSLSLF
ncbi:G-box-binding factor 1-like [Panicum miliaceum]|uniref:G-box-binding factor 1-like n=1 Tax=Panicum miliaceum TaxID=4540 RepID=A0A3L6SWQ2_PANMI|nr:G-box-binding factor 1-like [Panicum miliaceum]